MRNQTIGTLFDGQEWLAEPVNPKGWLAGPADFDPTASSELGSPVVQQDDISIEDGVVRRADGGRNGRTAGRSARRTARVRHLRRVRTDSQRSGDAVAGAGATGVRRRSVGRVAGLAGAGSALPTQQDVDTVGLGGMPVEASAEGYQLGRWSRLALTITALSAIVVVVVTLTAGSSASVMVDVTVAPGDTLWSIAERSAPDRDPRDVIEEIRQLNDLQGGMLPIGVVLRVPADAN